MKMYVVLICLSWYDKAILYSMLSGQLYSREFHSECLSENVFIAKIIFRNRDKNK